jgi:DNA-directed RNA polymerase subunit beta'
MKSVPSRIGLLLDLPVRKLEQVVYFASYIITDIYEEKRDEALKNLDERYKTTKAETQKDIQREVNELKLKKEAGELTNKKYNDAEHAVMTRLDDLNEEFEELKKGLT